MQKRADAYRSIGEAARLVGVATHVLRYWETQFPQLKPLRRPDGRRYYRLDDVRLAAGLAAVLREDGLTTRGAARLIAEDGGAGLRARGAARLPDGFAAPPDADTDGPRRPGATPPADAPAARTRRAAKLAARPLSLFSDLDREADRGYGDAGARRPATAPPAADGADAAGASGPATPGRTAPPIASPLPRIAALIAWLDDNPAPRPTADLHRAIASLRRHLARP